MQLLRDLLPDDEHVTGSALGGVGVQQAREEGQALVLGRASLQAVAQLVVPHRQRHRHAVGVERVHVKVLDPGVLCRVAGLVVGAVWVVGLAVAHEGAGEAATNVGVHIPHELHAAALAALPGDVLDFGLRVLQQVVPGSSWEPQLVEGIQASRLKELLAKVLAHVGQRQHVGVQVEVVKLAACGDLAGCQDAKQLLMILVSDFFLPELIEVGLLLPGHRSIPEASVLHGAVREGDLLQEHAEPLQSHSVSILADPGVVHGHVAEAAGQIVGRSLRQRSYEGVHAVFHELAAVEEGDLDVLAVEELDAPQLLRGLRQNLDLELLELTVKEVGEATLQPRPSVA